MALKVYYHVYTTGDIYGDLYIIDEQLKALQWSGLLYYADINAVISGIGCYYAKDLIERTLGIDRRRTVRIVECTEGDPEGLYEGRTLRHLWNEAESGDEICYIHTKGISYLTGQRRVAGEMKPRHIKAINGWRLEMENKILTEWRLRQAQLAHSDTQGCFFKHLPFWHYMGNFWWARGDYIRSLPNPVTFTHKPYPGEEYPETSPARMKHEQWLFLQEGYHLNLKDCPAPTAKKIPGYSTEFTPYEDDISEL
jgi:hypothetical protein